MATDAIDLDPVIALSDWELVRRQWARIRRSWDTRWRELQEFGLRRFGATIRRDPQAQHDRVRAFWGLLDDSRQSLDLIGRLVEQVPAGRERAAELEDRYRALAAGFFAEVRPAPTTDAMGSPVAAGVIVAGVVIGVAGIAWAIAAYQEALALREQTQFLKDELVARLQVAREGAQLPPSVLQPAPRPGGGPSPSTLGWWLLGGLVLGTAALAVPVLLPRRRSS